MKTMQREDDKDKVRFTSVILIKHDRQQERKRGRTYRDCRLVRFPRLSGMLPVSWLVSSSLQQWEYEVETIQRERTTKTE